MNELHWIDTPDWLTKLSERMEVPVTRVGVAEKWLNAGTDLRGTVIIGQPLLDELSIDEIKIVLAHELAHVKVSGSFLGLWVLAETATAMRKLNRYFNATHPLVILMNWKRLYRVLFELMRPARWAEEHGADVIAAAYVGRDAAAATLMKLGYLHGSLDGSDDNHPPLWKRIVLVYLLTKPAIPVQASRQTVG